MHMRYILLSPAALNSERLCQRAIPGRQHDAASQLKPEPVACMCRSQEPRGCTDHSEDMETAVNFFLSPRTLGPFGLFFFFAQDSPTSNKRSADAVMNTSANAVGSSGALSNSSLDPRYALPFGRCKICNIDDVSQVGGARLLHWHCQTATSWSR